MPPDSLAHEQWTQSQVEVYTSEVDDDDFAQGRNLWRLFIEQGADQEFIDSVSDNLSKAHPDVQKETVKMFGRVEKVIGERIEKRLAELSGH